MRSSLLCRQPGKEGRGRNCFHLILYNKEKVDPEDMSKMYNNSQIEMVATWRGQDVSKPHQHHGTGMTASLPRDKATNNTEQTSRRSPTTPVQGEERERRYQGCAWASQSHRGQRGTPRVPRREQMMGEDGLSSLQTHLQEVAQPVQAHGQGQRMGERPTLPTTVQARSSTPRSCKLSKQRQ